MRLLSLFVVLAILSFCGPVFAGEEEVSCPPEATQDSNSSGGGPQAPSVPAGSSDGGNTADQLGKTFDPQAGGEGGMGPMVGPGGSGSGGGGKKKLPFDTSNPLNHDAIRQYLKEVNKLVKQHGEELTNLRDQIKMKREYVNLALRKYGDAMANQFKARQRTQKILDRLGELGPMINAPNVPHDKWSEMVHEDSKLKIEVVNALQQEEIANNQMTQATQGLEFSLKSLKESVAEYNQATGGNASPGGGQTRSR